VNSKHGGRHCRGRLELAAHKQAHQGPPDRLPSARTIAPPSAGDAPCKKGRLMRMLWCGTATPLAASPLPQTPKPCERTHHS
jgi:hypothetical protein